MHSIAFPCQRRLVGLVRVLVNASWHTRSCRDGGGYASKREPPPSGIYWQRCLGRSLPFTTVGLCCLAGSMRAVGPTPDAQSLRRLLESGMPAVVSLGMLRWGCWAESHVQEGFVCLNVCALIQGSFAEKKYQRAEHPASSNARARKEGKTMKTGTAVWRFATMSVG